MSSGEGGALSLCTISGRITDENGDRSLGFNAPTKYPYTGRNTVVNAIAEAGIQYDTAWPEKVVLTRNDKSENLVARVTIDFTKVYEVGDMKQNYVLEEGNRWLPRTP